MSGSDAAMDSSLIAIIGMAGRFPGARNVEEFWRNLRAGTESVRFFSEEHLRAVGERPELIDDPGYVKAQPVLDDVDKFDAGFFGLSARDAAVMDPQQRIFLELAWEAMEQAGYAPDAAPGAVGVFAACGMNSYMMRHLVGNAEIMETVGEWLVRHTGNDMNFLATRVSYQMNLKGPSMNVQTACSSALVGIHLACQLLLSGECDMALAGATTITLPQERGYTFQPGEILSPDGHCRPFDARAGGTVFGSGAGCVVLRRLEDAVRDGDPLLAVIRGSAVNNDGADKVSYLAPGVEGQARVISEALAIAGVDAGSISYVEAHGTGTPVGDPIEVAALTQAFRAQTDARRFCALGSVKGNIGHLGEAAGMASVIKMVLALQHRELPPSINFESPNPELDLANGPFFVNDRLRPWTSTGPRRAGITALGAGGTNAHLVIEEAPRAAPREPVRGPHLLVLSARSPAAVDRASALLADHLERHATLDPADAAYTLQVGRKHFSYRRSLVAGDRAAAIEALRDAPGKVAKSHAAARVAPSVVFMFPGGGAQYPGMGRDLYERWQSYRQGFDECLASLDPSVATRIRAVVLTRETHSQGAARELAAPGVALPALFATEYATARLLMASGVEAVACIGHSMGEYVAACLSGVFSLRDAMSLVALRGRLFETLPPGGMLSVQLPVEELRPLLSPELSIAAVNAPSLCAVSGPADAIEAQMRLLAERGVDARRIPISVAAHSSMVTPILEEFRSTLRRVRFSPPQLPFVSNVTGDFITAGEATDPEYWVQHLRGTVRFADGVARLVGQQPRVLVEVGPGRTLTSLARQQSAKPTSVPTLRHPDEVCSDSEFFLGAVGRIWQAGASVDFTSLHQSGLPRRVALPSYPFERERHWIDASDGVAPRVTGALRKRADVSEWFYAPAWHRSATPSAAASERPWLIFADEPGLAERLAARRGPEAVLVVPGERFARIGENRYSIRAGARADYDALLEELTLSERFPSQVVHMLGVTRLPTGLAAVMRPPDDLRDLGEAEGFYFHSLLLLAQALAAGEEPLILSVVTTGMHQIGAEQEIEPAKALAVGPMRVIPRELPHIRTRCIDIELPGGKVASLDRLAQRLERELAASVRDETIALRAGERWVQRFEPLPLEPVAAGSPAFREGATVLITGGLGDIGLELAMHLARTARAKLVLVGRSALPPRAEWTAFIVQHGADDPVSGRLAKLMAIEDAGGEYLAVAGDVTDVESMKDVLGAARQRFGSVHAIVHAAGVIDDALIATKTGAAASAVILPKVKGALVLEQVFRHEPLEVFVVFSSVSALLGLEGQIDYTAANAYLDAFAQRLQARGVVRAVSIGWNAWQEVGMAAAIAKRAKADTALLRHRAAPHARLERAARGPAGDHFFTTSFSMSGDWLLSEHVVREAEAVMPGTGYLEIVRAAVTTLKRADRSDSGSGAIELREVSFLSPFAVRMGESRDLRLQLTRDGADEFRFSFGSDSESEPHVVGRAAVIATPVPPRVAFEKLAARCAREVKVEGYLDQPFVQFGPRWANIERILYGEGEALVALALPEPYLPDLDAYPLHPALVDMATGAAQSLIPGFDQATDFFVPMSYGCVTIHRPLPPRLWSHVRYRGVGRADLASFDVTLYDEAGVTLVEVADFRMKRLANARSLGEAPRALGGSAGSDAPSRTGVRDRLNDAVRNGIASAEGMDALDRVLASGLSGHIVASSVDINDWRAWLDAGSRPKDAADAVGGGVVRSSRPQMESLYVEPRNKVEAKLAEIWSGLLGVAQVGVHDDFFDLGGTSLVAVRMFTRICAQFNVDFPLSILFEASTIAKTAVLVAAEAGIPLEDAPVGTDGSSMSGPRDAPPQAATRASTRRSRWRSLVLMQSEGTKPPFYCIAGMGGTLNNLRKLALLMGERRPFYGLQPPGADDRRELLYTVQELAAHYVRELREVQPHGPYFLGGYSGGGVSAFEMARQLTAAGERVVFLGFIDSFSPALPRRRLVDRMRIHLGRARIQGAEYLVDTVRRRLSYERGMLWRRLGHVLGAIFPREYRYESIQESWLVAEARYRPEPWEGRATLFRAREESAVSLWTAFEIDRAHGWGRYLTGVQVEECSGNHSTMCEEPNVRVLASKLLQAIDAGEMREGERLDQVTRQENNAGKGIVTLSV